MHYLIGVTGLGRVDKAFQGRLFVATNFIHLFMFPLIPLRSYAVVSEDGSYFGPFQVRPIDFNLKSIFYAYGRGLAVFAIIAGAVSLAPVYISAFSTPLHIVGLSPPVAIAVGAALYAIMHFTSYASAHRAAQPQQITGFMPSSTVKT